MQKGVISKYGLSWKAKPLQIELEMIKNGGKIKRQNGTWAGEGLIFHFLEAIKLCFPWLTLHKWNMQFWEEFCKNRTIGVIGPASSGKTCDAAAAGLIQWWSMPRGTTVLCCSTTKERLEDRIFGEIKKLFRSAKEIHPWLPGHLIEGRQRIVADAKLSISNGRDFRNGIIGVPCKKGDSYIGMGDFAGIKNKMVLLLGDELSLLPRIFVDAISNLDKNEGFKAVGLGNPKDTTDALGLFAEPHPDLGGWDGGIDQQPGTKVWRTKRPKGVCQQRPGSDSPNLDGKLGIPLITQEQIDRDVAFYGKDSLFFTMMDEGKMPRGQGTRRVITRQMCERFHALDQPLWLNGYRTMIGFLDAAYGGVGGDRCIFGMLQFGQEAAFPISDGALNLSGLANQGVSSRTERRILALDSLMIVPIKNDAPESPEDQISQFCKKECEARGIVPQNFFFDSGMRTSLVSSMARIWSPSVMPIDCGGPASKRKVSGNIDKLCREYYSKFVTELWFSVRLIIESGQFRGMTEDVMMEGCAREWTMVAGNKIEVEPKKIMKEKTGRSPDLFDALAIGCEGARQRGFVILKLDNPAATKIDFEWKRRLQKQASELHGSSVLDHA